jgi:anti-sigma factor RsiW
MNAGESKPSCLSVATAVAFVGESLDDDRVKEVCAHLAACEKCRGLFTAMQTLRSAGAALVSGTPTDAVGSDEISAGCVPTETMGDYMGGRLPERERNAYSTHVAECGQCFDRAAHVMASSARMARGLLEMEPTPHRYLDAVAPRNALTPSMFEAMRDILRRVASSPIPAYAFSGVIFLVMIMGRVGGPVGAVIPLESDKSYSIYEKPETGGPTFGFSDAGRKVGETGAGLAVERIAKDGRVEFRWNAVKDAVDYSLMIMEITPRGPKEVFDTKTPDAFAKVDATLFTKGKAYRWRVTATGENGRVFVAVGQFALGDG